MNDVQRQPHVHRGAQGLRADDVAAMDYRGRAFRGGFMDGAQLEIEQIKAIARLPSREVLHSQLVGTIAAPLSGLVRTLNALLAGLAVQLQQIAEQGLVSGPPPEATAAEPDTAAEAEGETRAAEPEAEAPETEQPEPEAEAASDAEPSDE